MIKNKGKLKHSIFILAAAGAITLAAASGVFRNADLALQDRLYQRPRPVDDTITIIGIDTKALEDIGPYQDWGRDIQSIYLLMIQILFMQLYVRNLELYSL